MVCVGHYNYPNLVSFPGEESFRGKILHSHDFKNGSDFKGKKVLCIGGSYSAEDICLNCWKNGAEYAHVSTRRPGGFGLVRTFLSNKMRRLTVLAKIDLHYNIIYVQLF